MGDKSLATSAEIKNPYAVVLDSSGNLYFSDIYNNVIRKVDTQGIITTIAGDGSAGYSGDGGIATSASLNCPNGLVVDASGNVYISDSCNHAVRKVDSSGKISTIVGNGKPGYKGDGGAAASALLNYPRGLAIDAAGNLYVADTSNSVVRKIDPSGIITTFAGNGKPGSSGDGSLATKASLASPSAVVIDSLNNLYIAESFGNKIRKVDARGVITTLAGNGQEGFSGDGGAAASAIIDYPLGLALDSGGNLYIADYENSAIRKIDAKTQTISTVAGNGSAGFSGDGGVAITAQLSRPPGIAVDAAGNLYIADDGNHVLRKVTAQTQVISTMAGISPTNASTAPQIDGTLANSVLLNEPTGITLDSLGNLYIVDGSIRKIGPSGKILTIPATLSLGTNSSSDPDAQSTKIKLHFSGNITAFGDSLYLVLGNSVIKVDSSGNASVVAGTGAAGYSGDGGVATSASFNNPLGLVFDGAGNLYIADTGNQRIRKVDAKTQIISTIAGNGSKDYKGDGDVATNAQLNNPTNVTLDGAGNLFILDKGNNVIRRVDGGSHIISTVAGSVNTPTNIAGLAVDAAGIIYIADSGKNMVSQISSESSVAVAGNGSTGYSGDGSSAISAKLHTPSALALDSSGNLYILDSGNKVIRMVSSASKSVGPGGEEAAETKAGETTAEAGDAQGTGGGGGCSLITK